MELQHFAGRKLLLVFMQPGCGPCHSITPELNVLFDLLYHAGRCQVREPLARRREVPAEMCRKLDAAEMRFSEGMVGQGMALYAAALAQGHEGVMAKHLASAYRPGKRSAAWRKIKPRPRGDLSKARHFFVEKSRGPERTRNPRPEN